MNAKSSRSLRSVSLFVFRPTPPVPCPLSPVPYPLLFVFVVVVAVVVRPVLTPPLGIASDTHASKHHPPL